MAKKNRTPPTKNPVPLTVEDAGIAHRIYLRTGTSRHTLRWLYADRTDASLMRRLTRRRLRQAVRP